MQDHCEPPLNALGALKSAIQIQSIIIIINWWWAEGTTCQHIVHGGQSPHHRNCAKAETLVVHTKMYIQHPLIMNWLSHLLQYALLPLDGAEHDLPGL